MIEFAISAIILFMLIIMGLDIVRFGYSTLTLHFVMSQSARYAVVGTLHNASGTLDQSTRTDAAKRVEAIKRYTRTTAERFGANLNESQISICKAVDVDSQGYCPAGTDDAGGSKDYIQISYSRVFRFFWRGIEYPQTISVLAKNEPY